MKAEVHTKTCKRIHITTVFTKFKCPKIKNSPNSSNSQANEFKNVVYE
jgi:hypothetical protein